jgi:hypothetical protein
MKLRQEKRMMAALEEDLQWYSKLQNPEFLDWCISNGKVCHDSGWRWVGRMAFYIKEMNNATASNVPNGSTQPSPQAPQSGEKTTTVIF